MTSVGTNKNLDRVRCILKKTGLFAYFFFGFFLLPNLAYAQVEGPDPGEVDTSVPTTTPFDFGGAIPLDFGFDVSPLVPTPSEFVTITLKASKPLDSAIIRWFINNVEQQIPAGYAKNVLVFKAPNERGSKTAVRVSVTLDGKTVEKTIPIQTVTFDVGEGARIQKDLEDRLRDLQNKYPEASLLPSQNGDSGSNVPFTLQSTNENPGANESVSLRLNSVVFDPNQALIQWFQDGKLVSEGIGNRQFTTITGSSGSKTTITARVTSGGQTYEDKKTIIPFTVSLYWWAETTIPYWYKGKALPTKNSLVRISAFAPVSLNEQKNLTYSWLINDEPQEYSSGVGKQTIQHRPRLSGLGDAVEVIVRTIDKTLSFKKLLTVENFNPEVRFCVVDITASCTKSTGSTEIEPGTSVDIRAFPFYFLSSEAKYLKYTWDIAGRSPTDKSNPEFLSLKPPESFHGTIGIRLTLEEIATKYSAENIFSLHVK